VSVTVINNVDWNGFSCHNVHVQELSKGVGSSVSLRFFIWSDDMAVKGMGASKPSIKSRGASSLSAGVKVGETLKGKGKPSNGSPMVKSPARVGGKGKAN
jgi:hypothetical protein